MQRSSIIATVIAAGGVMIAGSVASVAVINAASLTPHDSETVSVVAAGAPNTSSTQSTGASADDGAPAQSPAASPAASPEFTPEELPPLPDVSSSAQATVTRKIVDHEYTAPSRSASPNRESGSAQSDKPKAPSHSASAAASARATKPTVISSDTARDIVLTATNGGVIRSIQRGQHGAHSAWAVQLLRHDGSIVTGYVDVGSGVIYDWVVDQAAPTPTPSPSPSASDDDDSSNPDSPGGGENHSEDGDDD
jgi:hypothetical protein